MRSVFPQKVEAARSSHPTLGSTSKGDHWGFFDFMRGTRKIAVMVGDGSGWDHVSVSMANRCPTWDEMCWVKNLFFEPDETVLQYHPSVEEYVNLHPFCLHLWKPHGEILPKPPTWMVG